MKPARSLSLPQLRALEAVARKGSFSAAAQDLGISQPSVSNHVIAAESYSRASLIRRDGHSARATPALAAVLPQIRAMIALSGDIERRFRGTRSAATGSLSVAYSTPQLSMAVLSRFMTAHAGIEIEARAMASQDVVEAMAAGEVDVGFVTGREIPDGCAGEALLTTPVVLAVRADHPLAAKGSADWSDIAALDLIQRERASGTRRLFEGAAQLARVRLRTRLALGSWGSIVSMVQAGVGAGVALAAEVTASDGLTAVPVAGGRLTATHYVLCLKPMAGVAAVEALMRTAREVYLPA